jgi:hypothetical protein
VIPISTGHTHVEPKMIDMMEIDYGTIFGSLEDTDEEWEE